MREMKVKVRPEDFVVREEPLAAPRPAPDRFAVFALAKRQWDTFDLVSLLSRRLGVARSDISYGGIKDRFGATEQLVSVRAAALRGGSGGPLAVEERNFSLRPLGYAAEPVTAAAIRGNHFTITLRDMPQAERAQARSRLDAVARWGVPNYYDEQRFGSARHGKGWIGKEIFLGRREQALRLYFEPSGHDESRVRRLKTCVTENWGRWEQCLALATGRGAPSGYGPILEYLAANRRAFRRALMMIDRRLLLLMINAYQSFLFNQILSGVLLRLRAKSAFPALRYRTRWGELLFPESLADELFALLRGLALPVPGYDSAIADPLAAEVAAEVLQREGITLADLRVRQLPRMEVHGVTRPALALPERFAVLEDAEDDLYPGRAKLTLAFFLPRGCYATLVVKRLQATVRLE
jgi:tRNA pseudouridine13 synthase